MTSGFPSVPFAKAQAYGNDFLLVDDARCRLESLPVGELARRMCDRLRGIGADGLILYHLEGHQITMRLANSDGSQAAISGNGIRCLAAYLCHRGRSSKKLELVTSAGRFVLELLKRDGERFEFRANMGRPRLASQDVPLVIDPPLDRVLSQPLEIVGRTFSITALSMGNPHCVIFCDAIDLDFLREWGPIIESDPCFPNKTNVELVEVANGHELHMAVWERGAGETTSSGTGSSASAAAAILNGLVESPVTVHCAGGSSTVEWTPGDDLYLTGEASVVAEGSFLMEWKHET